MSERPAPGSLQGMRHCLDDAEIAVSRSGTVTIKCVSPNRAARIYDILTKLQKEGPDR